MPTILLLIAWAALVFAPAHANAEDTWTSIRPGVDLLYRTQTTPTRQQIHALRVDLTRPEVSLRASRDAVGTERRVVPTTFARNVGALASINGDWSDGTTPIGIAVGNGWFWHQQHEPHGWGIFGCNVYNQCDAAIIPRRAEAGWFQPHLYPWRYYNLVGGNGVPMIIDGVRGSGCYEPACGAAGCTNPRSFVCTDAPGTTLWMVVVDGRRSSAVGMNCEQTRDLMLNLGCHDAMMLDGGGSTALVVEGTVQNSPSDGGQRTVGSHLGLIYTTADDAACAGRRSAGWCEGSTVRTCNGGRLVNEGNCAAFGTACQTHGDWAFCVHPDCPAGNGMGGTCAGSVVTGCADGAPRTADCAAAGMACRATGGLAQCLPAACECVPGGRETGSCGSCGERSRVCGGDCRWQAWSGCTGEGACAPGATQSEACGVCGTRERSCTGACTWDGWGACSDTATCTPGDTESRACGRCGVQSRTCSEACGWGEWSACTGEGACDPGQVEDAPCCDCGSQSRQCDDACAWGDWTPCRTVDDFTSMPCDTGLGGDCAIGDTVCNDGCLACESTREPASEVCNGRDDDCNGETDEGEPLVVGDDVAPLAARADDVAFASVIGTDRILRGAVTFENVGTAPWAAGEVAVTIDSMRPDLWFVEGEWPDNDAVARTETTVIPGGLATFDIALRIPDTSIDATPRLVLTTGDGTPFACPDPDVDISRWVRIPDRENGGDADSDGGITEPLDAGTVDDDVSMGADAADASTPPESSESRSGCSVSPSTHAALGYALALLGFARVRRRRR